MATVKVFKLLYSSKDGMIEVLKRNIEEGISDEADDELEQVETRLEEYLNGFDHALEEYDEQLVRSYIEKITVYEDKFEIEFKAGFELNIER